MIQKNDFQIKFIKLIGKGAFAEVHLVKDIKNNRLLAAKKLYEKNLNSKEKFYLQNEINILKNCNTQILLNYIMYLKNLIIPC